MMADNLVARTEKRASIKFVTELLKEILQFSQHFSTYYRPYVSY